MPFNFRCRVETQTSRRHFVRFMGPGLLQLTVVIATLGLFALAAPPAWGAPFRVGLVFDRGGKDDKSFNSAANLGANRAVKELGVQLKSVEANDTAASEPHLRNFARAKFDLIVAVGFSQADAMKKVAPQFAGQNFALVDAEVDSKNVRSLLFQEHEGSFLVGAIAGLTTKTNKVGFIGGMDIPLIRRFQMGYEAGVKHVNPKAQVVNNYVGVTGEAWNNPPKGKELAVAQYGGGADIIFGAAGATNMGLLDAAEEKKKLAIGVDSNQNGLKPGYVLTSMLKRVDVAVFDTIKSAKEGKFKGGVARFGLADEGIDFAMDEHNKSLVTPAVLAKAKALKSDIIAGKVKVPDFYERGARK